MNGESIRRFLLSNYFGLPLTNLGTCSATNYNYKWLLTEWFIENPHARPLVIVGITSPLRLLIYDNQLDDFQKPANYILRNQRAFPSTYGGQNRLGGYRGIQLADSWLPGLKKWFTDVGTVGEHYIKHQLDDEYRDVEIAAIWEIVMLDAMIKQRRGTAVFWSNLWDFQLHENHYFSHLFCDIAQVKQLRRLIPVDELMGHPDINGHQKISQYIIDHIALTIYKT